MPEIFRCLSYLEQRNKTPDPIFTDSCKHFERPIIEEKFAELLHMVQTYDAKRDSFDLSKSALISKVMQTKKEYKRADIWDQLLKFHCVPA